VMHNDTESHPLHPLGPTRNALIFLRHTTRSSSNMASRIKIEYVISVGRVDELLSFVLCKPSYIQRYVL
jgi:hypothetical protein